MKRTFGILLCLTAVFALAGCFSSGGKRTVTTRSIDPATGQEKVVMTEQDTDFWESGNLRMYYENDSKRSDNHTAVAVKKVDGLIELERSRTYSTPTEAALGGVITSLLVAQVRESAPPPSSKTPTIFGDVAMSNGPTYAAMGVSLAGAVLDLDIGGPFGGGGQGNTSLKGVNIGGDFYNNSKRADQYYLEEGSAWGGQENPSFSWNYETYTGNSTNSGQEGQASTSLPSDDDTGLW